MGNNILKAPLLPEHEDMKDEPKADNGAAAVAVDTRQPIVVVNPDIEVVRERDFFKTRVQKVSALLFGCINFGVVGKHRATGGVRVCLIMASFLLGAGACFWLWKFSSKHFSGVPSSLVKKMVVYNVLYMLVSGILVAEAYYTAYFGGLKDIFVGGVGLAGYLIGVIALIFLGHRLGESRLQFLIAPTDAPTSGLGMV